MQSPSGRAGVLEYSGESEAAIVAPCECSERQRGCRGPGDEEGASPTWFHPEREATAALPRDQPKRDRRLQRGGAGQLSLRPPPIMSCPLLLHTEGTSVCCGKVQAGQRGGIGVPRLSMGGLGIVLACLGTCWQGGLPGVRVGGELAG